MKRRLTGCCLTLAAVAAVSFCAHAEYQVTEVDLLASTGQQVNAAGAHLVHADAARNRVIVANSLTSSVTIIDGATDAVTNIPVGSRGLQHLKAAALTIRAKTGHVYLVATGALIIVDPDQGTARTLPTTVQFESVAVDDATGNAFLCGRESEKLGVYSDRTGELTMMPWLETTEELANLNQTPPPPIRRAIAVPNPKAGKPGQIAAFDGMDSTFYLFDARTGKLKKSRKLDLQSGGRWHLAGVNGETGHVYVVTETSKREAIQAAKIDVAGKGDLVVELPKFTEPVGMTYNPRLDQVYIPYDNHPAVHVIDFAAGAELREIALPAYGNDAAAMDLDKGLLYIGSWAHGEVDVVDLATGTFIRPIHGLGIIPHMFAMAFNPANGMLYFPVGASAVNGCFGAAVTRLDPNTGESVKIHTGWAPIDLIEVPQRESFLVFNNEDQFAEVKADGTFTMHGLPHDYPLSAVTGPDAHVYLADGPHQSYWPVVYIWAARNGVLAIDPEDLSFYDRRIPRQPLEMAMGHDGALYLPQNNWGKEKQFISVVEDGVRYPNINERIELEEEVERETTQRLLRYDPNTRRLLLLRAGEADEDPSILQIIDPATGAVDHRYELAAGVTDLLFDPNQILVTAFGEDKVQNVVRANGTVLDVTTGDGPLAIALAKGRVFVIYHLGSAIEELGGEAGPVKLPFAGNPDNLLVWGDRLVVTIHDAQGLTVVTFDPDAGTFEEVLRDDYPNGDTRFDTGNSAFYMDGQFGDAVFELTSGRVDAQGRLWLTDFLSGRVFIISE